MAIEKERKYLVDLMAIPAEAFDGEREHVLQGYFNKGAPAVRVTAVQLYAPRGGELLKQSGWICVKGQGTETREEFEYEIPFEDAQRMLQLVDAVVVKNRYIYQGWEIDSFDTNDGEPFCVAEWEESANGRPAPSPLPDWIVKDVTEELQYTNQSIAWNGVPEPEKDECLVTM